MPFSSRPLRRPVALLLCSLLALPAPVALAQSPGTSSDLASAITGTARPLTMQVKDLDATWRQMSITKAGGSLDLLFLAAISGRSANIGIDQYFTHGETTTIGGETYLVAYRYALTQADLTRDGTSTPPQITPDTTLTLSLINIKQIASLDGIQPFVPISATQAQADAAKNAEDQSVSNLKQIGLGMIQYVQDYDEKFPPMQSAAIAKKAIYPYVKSDAIFQNPATHEPYRVNTSLSAHSLAEIEAPASVVAYYEASAAPDGLRAVLFTDGHVKRLPDADWRRLLAASHLPPPTKESF